jgi:hypothetical protein
MQEDLYAKICSLSYMGDLRMLFAEDKNKVMIDIAQIDIQSETASSLSGINIFMLACYFASAGIICCSDLAEIN